MGGPLITLYGWMQELFLCICFKCSQRYGTLKGSFWKCIPPAWCCPRSITGSRAPWDSSVRLVSLSQSPETANRRVGGDLSSFPLHLSLLFVLVSIDEQQPSILSSSETKCCRYSRPASSKLAAWPSFSSLGRLHKAIALPWGEKCN